MLWVEGCMELRGSGWMQSFQEEREEREAAGEDTEQGGSDGPSLNGKEKI